MTNGVGGSSMLSMDTFVPGTAKNSTSTVEISISCRNLLNADLLSKSDPMVVMYNRPAGSKLNWHQFMRTEVINDNLDPDFEAKAVLDYKFEQVQMLRFEVYDIDIDGADLSSHDKLGMAEVSLGQIVSAGTEGLAVDLIPFKDTEKSAGKIILTAEELASEKDEITLQVAGSSIGRWSGLCPPKSFWSVSKLMPSGKYVVLFRSADSRGTNPSWQSLKISSRNFCNGDFNREVKIEVFQRNFSGAITKIGETITCLNELKEKAQDTASGRVQLRGPTGELVDSYVRIQTCTIEPINTFLEYIQKETSIMACFAIDFTCSNGDPTDGESLHYLSDTGKQPNVYEQAIQAVGNVIKDYDNASLFPAYGFGARIPPDGDICHNFHVNFKPSPNCDSIAGVLEEYRNCLGKIQLYAPTYFAPVINKVAHLASKVKPGENYLVLVIITDGVISDMAMTKKAIVQASTLPLSIIIIGVGEANFDAMEELDGDAVRISYRGKKAARDIVQFVAYRSARSWMSSTGEETVNMDENEDDHHSSRPGDNRRRQMQKQQYHIPQVMNNGGYENRDERENRMAQSHLAKEVLEEIPAQLTSYMRSQGIKPSMVTPRPRREDE